MYKGELNTLKKAGLFRDRVIYDEGLTDLASNDYLGFAEDEELFDKAVRRVKKYKSHSPKASQLVNGYHQVHKDFEEYLCERNGFESGIVVGSGFLANLALIEALPRKGDLLILDEEYHASGILASKLPNTSVKFFKHNDSSDLMNILKENNYKRAIVAVEGVYSMGGELMNHEIFDICDEFEAILIVDEAHSAGVVGKSFLGVFEHLGIEVKKNHIKMGTLGKAIGSYGAYILADKEIVMFLQNRAKAIVYATAPSVFDIALSHEVMLKIDKNHKNLFLKRAKVQTIVKEIFSKDLDSLILKIEVGNNQKVMQIKKLAYEKGFLIGAIRPPTVKSAILRVILRLNVDEEDLREFLSFLKGSI